VRRDWKDTAIGSTAVLLDIGFGHLKAVLGIFLARYEGYEVCLDPSFKTLSRLTRRQEKVYTRDTIKHLLSRMAALEMIFIVPPGDMGEERRRTELIRYAIVPLLDQVLISFQQAPEDRRTTAGVGREARPTAIC